MERLARKPFQGVINIIRFNWHFYLVALMAVIILFVIKTLWPFLNIALSIFILLIVIITIISLSVSWYVYDYSNLYSLNWLNCLTIEGEKKLVNINAGFDETSHLLTKKYSNSKLTVFDFYDPQKHTEVSIERARKAYPAFPGTKSIATDNVPLHQNSIDYIFLILAAHEIRNREERIVFFKQAANSLNADGRIVVTEHLRDKNNFLAYNIGFFHFFSKKNWETAFTKAGLSIDSKIKITPFMLTFILKKNGNPS